MYAIYTKNGHGTLIVVDEEMCLFYQKSGSDIFYIEGSPDLNLDGGAYAEQPHLLTQQELRNAEEQGVIGDAKQYLKEIKTTFAKGA